MPPSSRPSDVRERILATAASLFYEQGARAVGIDLVIERAKVAKASLYRHFATKDDLVAAFLELEDADFWRTWDAVAAEHAGDPAAELEAHARWIAERLARPGYRGCPQLNVAAEFADPNHPARRVAVDHKRRMRARLRSSAELLEVADPDQLAGQLTVLFNGAFVSSGVIDAGEAEALLVMAVRALAAGSARRGA
ncbi:MAG: TetR/AcrR family transcriptional regulator [Deltaproteobacteria bacterium]|nr:TetR/AcrR family transcriptional regulator [Deltaproteobacteria bacterium]